jgi:hypothetical protein
LLTYLADVEPSHSSKKGNGLQQAAELLKSEEDSEDEDPDDVKEASAALLEALTLQGGNYWVKAVRGSLPAAIAVREAGGQSKEDTTWVFNLPLLIKKTPELRLLLEKQPYIKTQDSSAAYVRFTAMRRNGSSARSSMSEEDHSDDEDLGQQEDDDASDVMLEPKPKPKLPSTTASTPAAAHAMAGSGGGGGGAAAVAARAAANDQYRPFLAEQQAADTLVEAAEEVRRNRDILAAAAAAGPLRSWKRGPAPTLDYTQPLPGLGPVQVSFLFIE